MLRNSSRNMLTAPPPQRFATAIPQDTPQHFLRGLQSRHLTSKSSRRDRARARSRPVNEGSTSFLADKSAISTHNRSLQSMWPSPAIPQPSGTTQTRGLFAHDRDRKSTRLNSSHL